MIQANFVVLSEKIHVFAIIPPFLRKYHEYLRHGFLKRAKNRTAQTFFSDHLKNHRPENFSRFARSARAVHPARFLNELPPPLFFLPFFSLLSSSLSFSLSFYFFLPFIFFSFCSIVIQKARKSASKISATFREVFSILFMFEKKYFFRKSK